MTETRNVSIDEVRALVAERQRYDDWLAALDAKRTETPVRVFDRVQGDYVARRSDVLTRLSAHVDGLAHMAAQLDEQLSGLESHLGSLEDERAEAMLRTAVGEYDGDRWEQVRQHVEAQIAQMSEQRSSLLSESDEVRTLLSSAQLVPQVSTIVEPEPEPVVETVPEPLASETREFIVETQALTSTADVHDVLVFGEASTSTQITAIPPQVDELAELDSALALFSNDTTSDRFDHGQHASGPTGLPTALDGVDVFDDAELGDLRMSPPAPNASHATATVTPMSSTTTNASSDASRETFDDLAFLRSVVDPSGATGAPRAPTAGEPTKTLRCTECGTMNLPTEWYCERCGGELAAF